MITLKDIVRLRAIFHRNGGAYRSSVIASLLFSITFAAVYISSPLESIKGPADVVEEMIGRILVALPAPFILWLIFVPFSKDISERSGENVRRNADGAGIYSAESEFEAIRRIINLTGLKVTKNRNYDEIEWNQASLAIETIKHQYAQVLSLWKVSLLFLFELIKWFLRFLIIAIFVIVCSGKAGLYQQDLGKLFEIPLFMTVIFGCVSWSFANFFLTWRRISGLVSFAFTVVLFSSLLLVLLIVSFNGGFNWRFFLISFIPFVVGLVSCWVSFSRVPIVICRALFDAELLESANFEKSSAVSPQGELAVSKMRHGFLSRSGYINLSGLILIRRLLIG